MNTKLWNRGNKELPDKPLADYSVRELLDYLEINFPYGKEEKLLELYSNGEIGTILFQQVSRVLEGLNVKI